MPIKSFQILRNKALFTIAKKFVKKDKLINLFNGAYCPGKPSMDQNRQVLLSSSTGPAPPIRNTMHDDTTIWNNRKNNNEFKQRPNIKDDLKSHYFDHSFIAITIEWSFISSLFSRSVQRLNSPHLQTILSSQTDLFLQLATILKHL